MKIKRYEARTEQEAIEMVKNELGKDAIVLNIKKTEPKGIRALFVKPSVEVTAAFDEQYVSAQQPELPEQPQKEQPLPPVMSEDDDLLRLLRSDDDGDKYVNPEIALPEVDIINREKEEFFGSELTGMMKDITISEQEARIKELESRLNSSEQSLKNMSKQITHTIQKQRNTGRKYKSPTIEMFYDTFINLGVLEEVADYILDEIDKVSDIGNVDIDIIVKIIYNTILSIIGTADVPEPQRVDKNLSSTAVYAFIGPTGVGKTTTIAKIAADYMLSRGLNVGLITSDTYRIAAVEQLKLYGDILGVEVGVVYNPQDMSEYIKTLSVNNDVILIDTAGRSHKNTEMIDEISQMLIAAQGCEVFLVVSLTTKYNDLEKILEAYSKIADYRLILTKWDETSQVGSILNMAYKTGKKIAYISTGQNVPQDLEMMRPEKIARALMGLEV